MELTDKVVVVTGGGSGIGRAMARRFSAEGARAVVVADLDGASAQQVADQIAGYAVRADVSVEADVLRLIDEVTEHYGPIDLFCSNAGVSVTGGPEVSDVMWQRTWQVNVMAQVYAARALVPRMLERGEGYLLQTASAAGLLSQFDAPYAVTKHAAVAFSEWLSITYGDRGIGVSCLCPGGVDTPMLQAETETRRELMSAGHRLQPEDVADAVVAGLREERFLILPHAEILDYFQARANDMESWLKGMRRLHAKAR